MYFTDDSLLPENQAPLMITAAPYGPMWMPEDCTPGQKSRTGTRDAEDRSHILID
jgi:hypothetical protein